MLTEKLLLQIGIVLTLMCLGSFFNQLIDRLNPQNQLGLLNPQRSVCINCRYPIRIFDNLPVVSWLLLGGRCRHCQAAIGLRTLLVEALFMLIGIGLALALGGILE